MKAFLIIFFCCFIAYLIFYGFVSFNRPIANIWKLPLETDNRQNWSTIIMEPDAHFKALRAPFENVKLHYHTGIDLQSRNNNRPEESIYPIAAGKVIAIEDPPPQRRITIEHILPDRTKVWSVYIHIMAEKVKVGHIVNTETVIARLMNPVELENFGWEYHHIHLEIMKKLPPFASEFYERKTFTCYTEDEVDEYFYDPVVFLRNHFEE